jgi:hypothetical protein
MFWIERISGNFILSRFEEKEPFCMGKDLERRLCFTDEHWLKFVTICNQVNIWAWKKNGMIIPISLMDGAGEWNLRSAQVAVTPDQKIWIGL